MNQRTSLLSRLAKLALFLNMLFGAVQISSAAGIVYPAGFDTEPEKACYREYQAELGGCQIEYDNSIAACAGSNWFSRQGCYIAASYAYDICASAVGRNYGTCLSAAWKQVGKYQYPVAAPEVREPIQPGYPATQP